MKEIVVDVTTLKQWKSTLDVWFKQGHTWLSGEKDYHEEYFDYGERKLLLTVDNDIQMPSDYAPYIEYSDFMSQQQKEGNKVEVHYVTQEQYDIINRLTDEAYPSLALTMNTFAYGSDYEEKFDPHVLFTDDFIEDGAEALTRFLAGDDTIEFKVKNKLYRLWRIDNGGDTVYLTFSLGTPDWDSVKDYAFTAPLEEIKKHKTVSWEIEEVK